MNWRMFAFYFGARFGAIGYGWLLAYALAQGGALKASVLFGTLMGLMLAFFIWGVWEYRRSLREEDDE
jgi:hypothetical protein